MSQEKKERIFISYKRVDKERVFAIKDGIKKATDEDCWIDLNGIESDEQFSNVIVKAINRCEVFLFMYSKEHAKITDFEEDWTIKEITFAKEKKKRIVIVNIDDTPLIDQFLFEFPRKQRIDASDASALAHLYKDLCSWLKIDIRKKTETTQSITLEDVATQELLLNDQVRESLPETKVREIVKFVLTADGISSKYQERFVQDLKYGLATAQNNLGFALEDPNQKVKWLNKAVKSGSGAAMLTLGKMYAYGEGIEKNTNKALDYFRKASAIGYHDEVVDLVNKLFVEEEEYESKDHEISPSNLIKSGDLYYELTDSDITSLKVVNHSTYKNCNILTIPEKINRHGVELTVKEIESYAFADCTSLLAITLPNSIKIIRKNAFENCSSLPLLIIPDSVEKIEDGAFKNCTSLKHITIPNDIVADSQMNLYDYCLKNGVYQSMDISSASIGVGDQAFYGCSAINSVTLTTHSIAEFCKGIGNDLLYRSGISAKRIIKINDVEHPHIKIPNEIKYIRNRTFYKCSTLEVVTIPETVLEINSWAFEGCNSLSTIKYTGTMQKWAAIKKSENWNNGVPATVIHCTDGDVEI